MTLCFASQCHFSGWTRRHSAEDRRHTTDGQCEFISNTSLNEFNKTKEKFEMTSLLIMKQKSCPLLHFIAVRIILSLSLLNIHQEVVLAVVLAIFMLRFPHNNCPWSSYISWCVCVWTRRRVLKPSVSSPSRPWRWQSRSRCWITSFSGAFPMSEYTANPYCTVNPSREVFVWIKSAQLYPSSMLENLTEVTAAGMGKITHIKQ